MIKESAFNKIKEREDAVKEKAESDELSRRIEELKRYETPVKQRKKDLKRKAEKASRFVNSPAWDDYADFLNEILVEINIDIKALGLMGGSSEDIGNRVIRLSERSQTIQNILNGTNALIEAIKK